MELIFFTSNRTKTQHAQYLCRHYNVKISNFREKTYHANYDEPRIADRDTLLTASFKSALQKARSAGLTASQPFLIEDTSVIIHSLSNEAKEYPGTEIKYWMRETQFEDIDFQLLFSGNDRSVTVRSDLLLYLPSVSKSPLRFTSESKGKVVENFNRNLKTNTIYPWLDNKTFNKWFCPDGENCSISELPIELADKYDFRRGAFEEMLSTLESHQLINKITSEKEFLGTRQVFADESICHIVTGMSCAGKTTIAEYLASKFSFLHVEASDFMHLIYLETHGEKSDVSLGEFAKDLLQNKPTEVAKRVLDFLEKYNWKHVIITGFRKLEEVEFIKQNYMSGLCKVIWIEANSEIRKKRKIIRNRDTESFKIENFEDRDARERSMGLDAINNMSQLTVIPNMSDFDEYYKVYRNSLIPTLSSDTGERIKESDFNSLRLKDLVVLTLYSLKGGGENSPFIGTGEICNKLNEQFQLSKPKFRENIGRMLNKSFDVFFEVYYDKQDKRKKFRLSNTGSGHAKLLLLRYCFESNKA